MLNILCIITNMLAINTYGVSIFNLDQFPDWANNTIVCADLEHNTTLFHLWSLIYTYKIKYKHNICPSYTYENLLLSLFPDKKGTIS